MADRRSDNRFTLTEAADGAEPDAYGWQPSYVLIGACSIVCLDCVDWAEHLDSIEDDPNQSVPAACSPAEFGYVRVSGARACESGFRPGQKDQPADVLVRLHAAGLSRIVFRMSDVGQPETRFEAWRFEDTEERTHVARIRFEPEDGRTGRTAGATCR